MTKTKKEISNFMVTFPIHPNKETQHRIDHSLFLLTIHNNNVARKLWKKYQFLVKTKEYKALQTLKDKNKFWSEHGFSKFGFQRFFKSQKMYKNTLVNSVILRAQSENLWRAFDKLLYDNAHKISFQQLNSLRFINNVGLTFDFNDNTFCFNIDKKNRISFKAKTDYEMMALKNYFQNTIIKKEIIRGKPRYFLLFVFEGIPYNKGRKLGHNSVGIDPSQQKMFCAFSDGEFKEYNLVEGLEFETSKEKRLKKKLDRQRRAANPEVYKKDGSIDKKFFDEQKRLNRGRYPWKISKGYLKTKHELADLSRKISVKRKINHFRLANEILTHANNIIVEHNAWKQFTRRSSKTMLTKKGKYRSKKRFGRSVSQGAPSMFITILENKSKNWKELSKFLKITEYNGCTQFDHTVRGFNPEFSDIRKRKLVLGDGNIVHRDFHAAMNILFCQNGNPEKTKSKGKDISHFCLEELNNFYEKHKIKLAM